MNSNNLCICGHIPASDPNPDCERCCLVWLVNRVEKLRATQSKYLKLKRPVDLKDAKRQGEIVDAAIVKLLEKESDQELF